MPFREPVPRCKQPLAFASTTSMRTRSGVAPVVCISSIEKRVNSYFTLDKSTIHGASWYTHASRRHQSACASVPELLGFPSSQPGAHHWEAGFAVNQHATDDSCSRNTGRGAATAGSVVIKSSRSTIIIIIISTTTTTTTTTTGGAVAAVAVARAVRESCRGCTADLIGGADEHHWKALRFDLSVSVSVSVCV